MDTLETASNIARIVQAGFSVFLVSGIIIAFLSWQSKQNLDRRSAAVGYSLTKNQSYFEARNRIEKIFEEEFKGKIKADASTIDTHVRHNDNTAKDIRLLLAHWEIMSLSIFHEILDDKTCFDMVGSTLVNTVYVLEDYIHEIRKNPLNVRRYDYVLIVYEEWKRRLEKEALENEGRISIYAQYMASGQSRQKFVRRLGLEKRRALRQFVKRAFQPTTDGNRPPSS